MYISNALKNWNFVSGWKKQKCKDILTHLKVYLDKDNYLYTEHEKKIICMFYQNIKNHFRNTFRFGGKKLYIIPPHRMSVDITSVFFSSKYILWKNRFIT